MINHAWLVAWCLICGGLMLMALLQDWRECRGRDIEPMGLVLLRWLLIGAALLAAPFYALWIWIGGACDRRGERRSDRNRSSPKNEI